MVPPSEWEKVPVEVRLAWNTRPIEDALRAEVAEWRVKAMAWMASPEAAQRLDGYRELGARAMKAEGEAASLRAERDNFRSVLEGAGYRNLDKIASETRNCAQLGAEAKARTLDIIAERDALRAEVAVVKAENERLVDACFKWEAEDKKLRADVERLKAMYESPLTEDELIAACGLWDVMANDGSDYANVRDWDAAIREVRSRLP